MTERRRAQKPPMDPEAREKQLSKMAYDLAEKQLLDGTASPSVITHFLKVATKREYLEQEILEKQRSFLEAKAESLHRDREGEELARAAIDAMKDYRPSDE